MKDKSIYIKGAFALLAGYILYKMFQRSPMVDGGTTQQQPKPAPKPEGNQTGVKVPPAKLDLMTITQMAKNLEKAMSGAGTDEDLIFAQFSKLTNDGDFKELSMAFGTRTIPSGYYFYETKGNMQTLLHSELSKSDIDKINNMLKTKGIKYRI